ncbi:MAG: hypothetical protein A2161_17435 [Candidatus Schekmanbacteria bacterium RBG_13_48_7]|uniref:Antitoxin n=1 Tax=Candidatus Schekmanbacteria bacterium RBG_13_48_7 TaxID=1817878 RepID=A0A1F7S465_9BACT|nr:MAG: hypothetical protein A2161_17435 [Candidatus Schekmanbacteria bacterium RBG_13_48_7]
MKTIYDTDITISAFDAKTHLSRFLREVENGQVFTITNRGRPVARLVPYLPEVNNLHRESIIKEFDGIRKKVKGKIDILSYIKEGRKH